MQLVSVIIPTWNRAHTIEAAVRSALRQTLPPLEVLVCDDGSDDATEAIVRAIGDSRVRWLAGRRGGRPAIPRNRGIAAAKGEWLAFLDSDDVWMPKKLETQMAIVSGSKTRAICTNALRVRPGGKECGPLLATTNASFSARELFQANKVVCSSAVLHRTLFPTVEGFPEASELKAIEDYALWARVSTLSDFSYIGEPLVRYFDDAENSVRAEELDRWRQRVVVFGDLLAWSRRHPTEISPITRRCARCEFLKALGIAPLYRLRLRMARAVRRVFRLKAPGVLV